MEWACGPGNEANKCKILTPFFLHYICMCITDIMSIRIMYRRDNTPLVRNETLYSLGKGTLWSRLRRIAEWQHLAGHCMQL